MKTRNLILLMALFAFGAKAQEVKFPPLDGSPADIVYYPLNAAKVKAGENSSPVIKVVYSRPSKKGREIFGVLEPFGKIYRLGANENTEIRFFKPVVIGKKEIAAGTYSLFAIPNKESWTLILNAQTDRWGAYSYNENKDVLRVEVPVKTLENVIEAFSITFVPQTDGAALVIGWDKTSVQLPVQFK
ncbi:DUF2911 domain-containing protein [Pedobacter nutrimenti]|uniref:DUF2911 family protein n=1 Tax=Pedobacter nutrimenti TaxID=1241337 RepID=A0A318UJR0_9SPHI|nr:DUF2911 domain-containing protein [Pedobacter nutrimenti]PYF75750.1 hypothetical protein B0O44_102304 [Pedobacter nutrimenti]